ncbi:MAG: hypothetical protein Greene041619_1185 [Candidatus Peregrinibacteria bacterium Greene0416_19]|nr:MAG: hypothetical protein Greene041619_1185 [Candidatus Peregrinibacteria bacterium Greene0416_19]
MTTARTVYLRRDRRSLVQQSRSMASAVERWINRLYRRYRLRGDPFPKELMLPSRVCEWIGVECRSIAVLRQDGSLVHQNVCIAKAAAESPS